MVSEKNCFNEMILFSTLFLGVARTIQKSCLKIYIDKFIITFLIFKNTCDLEAIISKKAGLDYKKFNFRFI